MAARCVYGDRQMQTLTRVSGGSAADVVWFGTLAGVIVGTVLRHWRTATTHNARHQRAPDSQCLFASVPKVRGFSS